MDLGVWKTCWPASWFSLISTHRSPVSPSEEGIPAQSLKTLPGEGPGLFFLRPSDARLVPHS